MVIVVGVTGPVARDVNGFRPVRWMFGDEGKLDALPGRDLGVGGAFSGAIVRAVLPSRYSMRSFSAVIHCPEYLKSCPYTGRLGIFGSAYSSRAIWRDMVRTLVSLFSIAG